MKIFYMPTTLHLAAEIGQGSSYEYKKFCDGELYIRIEDAQDFNGESVLVVASTVAPAEHVLGLFLLLDALTKCGARIHLFFTYFAYARQDRVAREGEALSAEVISAKLQQFPLEKIYILHSHSERLHQYLNFEALFPYQSFALLTEEIDIIIAPDKGAEAVCKVVAQKTHHDFFVLTKQRPAHEQVQIISATGNVAGKRVLIIDDMITTGRTTIEAARFLFEQGALSVDAVATHGVFCQGAIEALEKSPISSIHVTNSIYHKLCSTKIHTISIAPLIKAIVT